MRYIAGMNRGQIILFPEKLDDLVSDDNPVRFIDEFINLLDLVMLGFANVKPYSSAPGAPSYSPEILLKLYVYGYFKKIRSSRKLMEMCRTNIEAMWLLGRLMPDFRTIADFRKDNKSALKKVFKAFVRVCAELGIYKTEVGVQDGSKFRANNSKDNNVTISKLEKKLEIADERINKYLEEMDKLDNEERDSQKYTIEELNEKIEELRARKDEYNSLIDEMKEEGVTQKSFTDPDSRLMKTSNGGFNVCYNVQIVVDPESHLIGAIEVTSQGNDTGLLSPVVAGLKENLGIDVMEVVADNGYESKDDMLECLMNGTIPHVTPKHGVESYELELEYNEAEITDEMLSSTNPEDIKACLEAGVVPEIYADKGIDVSVDEVEVEDVPSDDGDAPLCFTLTEDGSAVICPDGSTLNKVSVLHNKGKTRFTSKSACRACTDKCTTSAFKQVDLRDGQTVLYLKRFRKIKRVTVRITPDKVKTKNRKCVVEHPFGTMKRSLDGSYVLLIGTEKVGAELSLLGLAYNIRRVINMVGTRWLIAKMREICTFTVCLFSEYTKLNTFSYSYSEYYCDPA
ncbi:MAG: IS1182 family transposase [Oscillospiraceae bacterium]|nr:IS1182 family transposase [Oscillospiraceae bacterium]